MANESMVIFNDNSIGDQYQSFTPETHEDRVKVFNAINSPDARLADVINTPIVVKDVIISKVRLAARLDDNGGKRQREGFIPEDQPEDGFRVILLDMEGKSYTATSRGIYNSMCNLRAVFGDLHFEDGLKMVVRQVSTKNGNTLTINLM